MPDYTLYDTQTGLIKRSGSHPYADQLELGENEAIDVTGDYPADKWKYEGGERVPYTPAMTLTDLRGMITMAVQNRLDDFARERGYDGIMSACTYASDPVPQFSAEGQRAVELRGQTWAMLYTMLAEMQAGTRTIPTSFADIEGELPNLTWE